jgi:hypothetical protein
LPCCLWVNTGTRSYERDSEENDGPHDSRRCEACRRGVCTFFKVERATKLALRSRRRSRAGRGSSPMNESEPIQYCKWNVK